MVKICPAWRGNLHFTMAWRQKTVPLLGMQVISTWKSVWTLETMKFFHRKWCKFQHQPYPKSIINDTHDIKMLYKLTRGIVYLIYHFLIFLKYLNLRFPQILQRLRLSLKLCLPRCWLSRGWVSPESSSLKCRKKGYWDTPESIRLFPKIMVPQNGWFIMENPYWKGWFGGTTIFGNIHNFPENQSCIWYLSSYREHLSSHLIWKQLCLIQHQGIHPTFWGLGCAAWRMWHTWAVQLWTQTAWWDEMKQNSTLSLYITIYYIYLYVYIYTCYNTVLKSENLRWNCDISKNIAT